MHKLLHQLFKKHQSVFKKRQGQGLVEYALILGLAALVVFAIVQLMRPAIEETFRNFAGNAPVAPPSLANYTPPPTNTLKPTKDLSATDTPTPSPTNTGEPTSTATGTATVTNTPTGTATPSCSGYGPYYLPNQVQAEDFACGGPSYAFVDSTGDGGPGSGAHRSDVTTEGPDLSSGGSGYYVGSIVASEWIAYDIDVQASQAYDIGFRVASDNSNGRFFIEYAKDGAVLYTSPTISVPNTGGGQSWQTINQPSVPMVGGVGQIRFVFQNGGFNLDYFEVYGAALPTATNTALPTNMPTTTPTASNTPPPTATPTETPTPTATPIAACQVYNSNDVPKDLEDAWKLWWLTITGTTSSIIDVPGTGTVADVNVLNLSGTHTAMGDLEFYLTNPRGLEVLLIGQTCTNKNDFNLNLDDEAASGNWPCPPTDGGEYRPTGYLGDFDNENVQGTWTLRIEDVARNDTGTLQSWSLEICTQ